MELRDLAISIVENLVDNYEKRNAVIIEIDKYFKSVNAINQAKKEPEREVLFTTEDGKGVFGGEKIYGVTDDFQITVSTYATINDKFIRSFSTIDLAREWIILNKPCLSVSEAISVFKKCCDGTYSDNIDRWNFTDDPIKFITGIKELAKSKINL